MACDVALMAVAREQDVGILRIYEWTVPTVSFGRHERAAGAYSPESLANAGLAAVRRPTGGRALLHSREVTYSVSLPIAHEVSWSAAYDLVNKCLLGAMHGLGIPARVVESTVNPYETPSELHVCFSGIAAGEIAVGERKLVASAVWRERGAYLQHGSILIHDDQRLLAPFLGFDAARPEPAAVLADWLATERSDGSTVDVVESALHEAFGHCGNASRWSIPTDVLDGIQRHRTALADPSWLWRR